ncbi:MAG: hypothetical protein NTY15_12585 [Planctomycetota bacterium]|nr:hypothetical protein [Planctomycetota bacterium]
MDSSQPPNVETTVNAFAVYTLHRPGDPFGLPFRTNHRGEFLIEDVPVGTVTIGPSGFGLAEDKEVICVPQDIREGVTSLATSDLGVLCVLLIDENYTGWFGRLGPLRANLHGPVESQVFVEMAGERFLAAIAATLRSRGACPTDSRYDKYSSRETATPRGAISRLLHLISEYICGASSAATECRRYTRYTAKHIWLPMLDLEEQSRRILDHIFDRL